MSINFRIIILNYLIKEKPTAVVTTGAKHFGRNLESVVFITLFYESNFIAHINANRLSPVKVRSTLIGGSKKMLFWDDLKFDEKIKIYDKGVNIKTKKGIYNLLVEYRSGDMCSPKIDSQEALKREMEYFIYCIKSNKKPINDGYAGLQVVKILEATDKSLKSSKKVRLKL